jgi:hypothetical protein
MSAIEKANNTVATGIQNAYDTVGKFLDKNPTLYKVVLVACHFFRAAAMCGFMLWMPIPLPITAGIMIIGSLLYRAAVERFCCFRFTIPSLVGAGTAWLAKLSIINFVTRAALASLGLIIVNSLAFLPFLGYIAWVIYLSHRDIEKRMKLLEETSQKTASSSCNCEAV